MSTQVHANLTEEQVTQISAGLDEPEWLLEKRLDALDALEELEMPDVIRTPGRNWTNLYDLDFEGFVDPLTAAEDKDQVGPDEVDSVDLIVSGSVAVTEDGARIGKGEGYSDLEYALLDTLDLVDETTPIATTVHESQVVDKQVAVDDHDVPLDLVVTPERAIETETPYDRSDGIDWSALDEERIEEMPVLRELRDGGTF